MKKGCKWCPAKISEIKPRLILGKCWKSGFNYYYHIISSSAMVRLLNGVGYTTGIYRVDSEHIKLDSSITRGYDKRLKKQRAYKIVTELPDPESQ